MDICIKTSDEVVKLDKHACDDYDYYCSKFFSDWFFSQLFFETCDILKKDDRSWY